MKNMIIGAMSMLIIIMGSVIFYNYSIEKEVFSNNNSANSNNDNSTNKEEDVNDNNDDVIDNREKLVQFDREFYNLNDITMDYRSSKKVKNYVDFNYDLDGDGIVDKITFYRKDDLFYAIKLNGVEVIENEFSPEIYIVDLNESDNKIEIVLHDQGPSWDPNYTIYSKKGDSLEEVYGIAGDSLKCDKNGTVLVDDSRSGTYSPEIYFEYMHINDSVVTNKSIDLKTISNIEFKNSKLFFSNDYANKNKVFNVGLDPSRLAEINVEQLNDDVSFKILDVENITNNGISEKKIKVELSDGRVGYIFYVAFSG